MPLTRVVAGEAHDLAQRAGEEVAEQGAALRSENTPADLDAMVEAWIAYDVPERGNRSALAS